VNIHYLAVSHNNFYILCIKTDYKQRLLTQRLYHSAWFQVADAYDHILSDDLRVLVCNQ